MEIQQLKYFVCAVHYGSIIKASQELYITRQTISSALTQLETELGFSLLQRGKNGVELTKEGQLFYSRIAHQFEEFEKIKKEMREFSSQYRLPIKIGIVSWADQREVILLESWIQAHSEIQGEILFLSGRQSNEMLEQGQLHFCLTTMPSEANLNFTSEQIAEYSLMLAVHRDNPLAGKMQITAQDFHSQTILTTTLGYGKLEYTGQKWMPFELEQHQICTEDPIYLYSLLAANRGVMACHDKNTVLNQMRDIRLIPFTQGFTFPYFLRTSSFTMRKRQYDEVARELTSYLKQNL